MMDTQPRVCRKCGYPVSYQDISDAHGPGVTQFVANIKTYPFDGRPAVTSICPGCRENLTLESTRAA